MKRIELTIIALSPLAIGRQKPGGSVSEAENYIPGSVIRGAIASQILQQFGQNDANLERDGGNFKSLFLEESAAIFQNAYPALAKINKEESAVVTDEINVLPATAVSSKTESGFKPSGNGVFDTLIDRFCAEKYNQPYDFNEPKSLEDKTDVRVEPYSGFYSKTNDTGVEDKYRSHSVNTRFLTRVGINRQRATAEDDILYSIEVLNESFLKSPKAKLKTWENIVYRSTILVEDGRVAELLKNFINTNTFRIGGSASRGLGKVQIKADDGNELEQVEFRLNNFNQKVKDRWEQWSIFGERQKKPLIGQIYFTLNLQSDAILTQNWQRITLISETMLQQITGVEDAGLKLEVAYSSYDYRSGWHSAWGLMKDIELVTNKGAVYLFSTTEDRKDQWIKALEKLEMKGVGDRTCEGFGQVQVCNDFHTVFREKAV